MKNRFVPLLVAVVVGAVSWIFFKNFAITGVNQIHVVPRQTVSDNTSVTTEPKRHETQLVESPREPAKTAGPPVETPPRIRVATFNLQAFDQVKSRKPEVLDVLARIGREFDVLAVQEIHSQSDDVLPRLVNLINKTGQAYDYAVGPRVGPAESTEQYGFVFNRQTVHLDRAELYTVDDRDDVFMYEPYVAWFRAVGPSAQDAFTFSLVNLRIDPAVVDQELELLDDLLTAVQRDGRQEDDIIVAGDFQAGPRQMAGIVRNHDIGFAVSDVPTNVVATDAWDNLIFYRSATNEFTGNAGVFDFLRMYNLTLDQAAAVSDHLPVWAEFRVTEGDVPGRVTQQPATSTLTR